jgi:hypothetical protein
MAKSSDPTRDPDFQKVVQTFLQPRVPKKKKAAKKAAKRKSKT